MKPIAVQIAMEAAGLILIATTIAVLGFFPARCSTGKLKSANGVPDRTGQAR
jgi:hypothetical protein